MLSEKEGACGEEKDTRKELEQKETAEKEEK